MLSNVCGRGGSASLKASSAHPVASLFIAAVLGGSLLCVSCAHTEPALQREQVLYVGTSNALTSLQHTVPSVPAPGNSVLEAALVVGGALLALWATQLRRSLNVTLSGAPPIAHDLKQTCNRRVRSSKS
jgi:hypothetical protein